MRVTFRAEFIGPTGKLNPGGYEWKNPPAALIEVYRKGDRWRARAIHQDNPKKSVDLERIGEAPTHGVMQAIVNESYRKQCSPWTMHDTDGNLLDRSTMQEEAGEFSRKELTHIGVIESQPRPGNYFKTVCGEMVHVHLIRSARSAQAPTCSKCRPEWEKTPPEKRFSSI